MASMSLQDPKYFPGPPQCWQLGKQVVRAGMAMRAHMLGEGQGTGSPLQVEVMPFLLLDFTCHRGNHLPLPSLLLQSHPYILLASVYGLENNRTSLSILVRTGSSQYLWMSANMLGPSCIFSFHLYLMLVSSKGW